MILPAPSQNPPLPRLSTWRADPALPDWMARGAMARAGSAPQAPSFAAALDAQVRRDLYEEKRLERTSMARLMRRPAWSAAWLVEHGFDTPATLADGIALTDIKTHLAAHPRGVIKPVHATNAWGVVPYVHDRDGLRDLFDDSHWTLPALQERLAAPMAKYGFPDLWQIEELVEARKGLPVPDDYKAYAFGGHIALVLQVRRTGGNLRYKFYDGGWSTVRTGKYPDSTDDTLPHPADAKALKACARAVSAALPVPFVRVDMFETTRGPVVGELTPEPGGYHLFDADVDRFLGVFFDAGAARLAHGIPAA